jgi:uncharacterized protein (TIGR02246 family)
MKRLALPLLFARASVLRCFRSGHIRDTAPVLLRGDHMKVLTKLILATATLLFSTASHSQSSDTAADEAAIRGVIAQMTDAFNRHDAAAATAMYSSDADFVSVRGDRSQSVSNVRDDLAKIFETRAKHATQATLDVTIRFVRPDIALAHVTNELSGLVTSDGKQLPSHRELSLRVFEKVPSGWRVTAFHNTLVRPFGT